MRTARAGIEGPTGPGPPRSRLIVPVIALAAAFSLAIGWYELLGMGEWHQYLEYDDGVWFGTAVRLAHGVLPYRSFVDDQPPGVPVLMLPFALWSRSVGTRTAFAWARAARRDGRRTGTGLGRPPPRCPDHGHRLRGDGRLPAVPHRSAHCDARAFLCHVLPAGPGGRFSGQPPERADRSPGAGGRLLRSGRRL